MKTLVIPQFFLSAALMALITTPVSTAQEQDEGQAEIGSRMVIASADDSGGLAEVQVFSTSMDGMGMENAFFVSDGAFASPDVFSLANNQSVQKEIELVDEQLQQIRKINQEFSQKISERIKDLTSGDMNEEKGRELSELIRNMNEQKKSQMEGVLLPHQFERLRQIALQTQIKQNGDAATLASEQLVEALGITDEQQAKLKQRAEEIKKEMEEKIAKMKEKAREQLLGELTREQRDKLTQLMGDQFEVTSPDFRDRIREIRESREQKQKD